MLNRNLRIALLGSGAAIAMAAVSMPAAADELGNLKAQIDSLQSKLATLEARQTVTESRGTVAPAAVIEAGDRARTFKWAGTDTSVNIGGYAKLDIIYDIGAALGDSLTINPPASGSTADNRQGQVRLHARQSRIWIKTWTPTDWGELATHIEGDFEGNGGNQVISNSTSFRLRHAYGRLGPVLAGQTWSNYMCIACLPETIDFSGAYGESFVRAPQLRYTHSFGNGVTAAISIENPETDVITSGGRQFGATSALAFDKAPDGIISATYKHSKGFVRAAVVLRYLSVDSGRAGTLAAPGIAVSDSTFGYGFNVGATWRFDAKNSVGGEFNYGQGIGRYLLVAVGGSATTAASCSLGCATNASRLHATTAYGGYGWFQHKWTDTIRSNLVTGFARVENDINILGAAASNNSISDFLSVHANVIWSPVKQVNFGVEFILAYTDGATLRGSNDSERIQIGLQYKF